MFNVIHHQQINEEIYQLQKLALHLFNDDCAYLVHMNKVYFPTVLHEYIASSM